MRAGVSPLLFHFGKIAPGAKMRPAPVLRRQIAGRLLGVAAGFCSSYGYAEPGSAGGALA